MKRKCKGCKALTYQGRKRCLLGHKTYIYVNTIGRTIIRPMEECNKPLTKDELTLELIKNTKHDNL